MAWEVRPGEERRWSWLVLAASCLSQMVSFGLFQSVGVIHLMLLDTFRDTSTRTAWAGSLFAATLLGVGPLSSWLTSRYGNRKICISAGLLGCIGLLCSSQCTNLYQLYASFGIFTGLSLGLSFAPGFMAVNEYFYQHRNMAVAISTSGVSIGMLLYPPLINYCWEKVGWRGTFVILAGISLQLCVCGAVYVPVRVRREKGFNRNANIKKHPEKLHLEAENPIDEECNKVVVEVTEESSERGLEEEVTVDVVSSDGDSGVICSEHSISTNVPSTRTDGLPKKHADESREEMWKSRVDYLSISKDLTTVDGPCLAYSTHRISMSESNLWKPTDHISLPKNDLQYISIQTLCDRPTNEPVMLYDGNTDARRISANSSKQLYVPGDAEDYNMFELSHTEAGGFNIKSNDLRLCTDARFLALCVNSFLVACGLCIVMLHINAFSKEVVGLDEESNAIIVSAMGATRLVGTVTFILLVQCKQLSKSSIFNLATLLYGLITLLAPLLVEAYPGLRVMLFYCSLFGFLTASFAAVVPVLLIETVGVQLMALAYGYVGLIAAIGTLISPPLAGYIYDESGQYPMSFYFGGSMIVLGAGMFIIANACYNTYLLQRDVGMPYNTDVEAMEPDSKESIVHPPGRGEIRDKRGAERSAWSSQLDIVEAMTTGSKLSKQHLGLQ